MSNLIWTYNKKLPLNRMYPRDSLFKAAFNYQSGANCDFSVYAGRNKLGYSIAFLVYAGRPQYGQGFNDLLRVI